MRGSLTRRVMMGVAALIIVVYGSFIFWLLMQSVFFKALLLATAVVGLPVWAIIYMFYTTDDHRTTKRMEEIAEQSSRAFAEIERKR